MAKSLRAKSLENPMRDITAVMECCASHWVKAGRG